MLTCRALKSRDVRYLLLDAIRTISSSTFSFVLRTLFHSYVFSDQLFPEHLSSRARPLYKATGDRPRQSATLRAATIDRDRRARHFARRVDCTVNAIIRLRPWTHEAPMAAAQKNSCSTVWRSFRYRPSTCSIAFSAFCGRVSRRDSVVRTSNSVFSVSSAMARVSRQRPCLSEHSLRDCGSALSPSSYARFDECGPSHASSCRQRSTHR